MPAPPRPVGGFRAKHSQEEHAGNRRVVAMYDKDLSTKWHVEIDFDEDETHTHATVHARCGDGETVTALGDAYRNPKDSSHPMIGEEIAAARGLIALGTKLLDMASSRIEHETHQPVHLYR
jgi:Domain of unknown function (DUF1876)